MNLNSFRSASQIDIELIIEDTGLRPLSMNMKSSICLLWEDGRDLACFCILIRTLP